MSLPQTQRPLRGAIMLLIAVFVFPCMDSIGKYLFQVESYSIALVQSARYIGHTLLMLVIFAPAGRTAIMLKTNRTWLVWLRAVSLAVSSLAAAHAFKLMPVAEASSIIYLGPFIVLLLSGPLLGERVRWFNWIATIFAFGGMLLIVRPGTGLAPIGVLSALAAAASTVVYQMLSRSLATTESTLGMLFITGFCGAIFFILQLVGGSGPWPTNPLDLGLFASLGALGLLGHGMFTSAYRLAPLSLLAPLNYVHLGWAVLLSWAVFNHVPDWITLTGIAVVAIAGAANAGLSHWFGRSLVGIDPEEV